MADYLFILNPKSGTSIGKNIDIVANTIRNTAQQYDQQAHIIFTEARSHATELVRENLKKSVWKAIVAVGGDGTINEIAIPLLNQATPLGILPLGSGNGLARHLGLPLTLSLALKRLFEGNEITIDTGQINEIPFFCTAGMGFDAYVGHLFSLQEQRGLATYVNVSFKAFWTYEPQILEVNGVSTKAFSLTFANAGQFGNNAWIAPEASLQDGMLDVCEIKPFPSWFGSALAFKLFTRQMKPSRFVTYKQATDAVILTKSPPLIHYDGEPLQLDTNRIEVKIVPQSLKVII